MTTRTAAAVDGAPVAAEPLIEYVAGVIARSRYEAWDSHAQEPNAIPWDEYRVVDPTTAEGIYLEDGRRDARALLPSLLVMMQRAGVKALRESIDRYQGATPQQRVHVLRYASIAGGDPVLAWLRILAAGAMPAPQIARVSDPAPPEGHDDHDHAD